MKTILCFFLLTLTTVAHAQTVQRESISLEAARKIMQAAENEAAKLNLHVAMAVLDESGHAVLFQRMDNAPLASSEVASRKARTAAVWKLPSKDFEQWLQGGMTRLLTLPDNQTLIEGGIPIVWNGKTVGAIGVSGGSSQQDAQIAQAGINGWLRDAKK